MEENNSFLKEETKPTEEKKVRKTRTKKEEFPTTSSAEIMPAEETITNELAKQNVTEEALRMMEEEFPKLEIRDINDKIGYKEVNDARTMCRNTRGLTVTICKSGREEAIRTQKLWVAKEKETVERIKTVEDGLAAKQKVVDDEKDRLKNEKDTLEQSRLQARAVELIKAGCAFDGEAYILDTIRISVLSVKTSDDFTWTSLFAAVERKFKENQELKLQEEERRIAAEAQHKLLIEAQLAKEEELKLKEQAIAAREKAIADAEAKQKLDAENKLKEEEQALKLKAEAILAQKEKEAFEIVKSRKSALFQLGFSQQGEQLTFKSLGIAENKLHLMSSAEWSAIILDFTVQANQIKEQLEKDRLVREEKIKTDAIAAEKKRADDEAQADHIAALEKAEALKKDQERLTALQPDITKFNNYCKAIAEVPVPEFSTSAYIEFAEVIKSDRLAYLKLSHNKKPN